MGFGNNQQRTYFKIKNGNIVVTIKAADEGNYTELINASNSTNDYKSDAGMDYLDICFGHFEGYLMKIDLVETEFNGTKVKQWALTFKDDTERIYVWNTIWNGSLIQGFVNCLSSVEGDIGPLKINAYLKNDKTRIAIYHKYDTKPLSWKFPPEELPQLEVVQIYNKVSKKMEDYIDKKTNKPIFDDTKRMEFVEGLIKELNQKLLLGKIAFIPNGNGDDPAQHLASEEEVVTGDDGVPF